jgi:hypothetical protein
MQVFRVENENDKTQKLCDWMRICPRTNGNGFIMCKDCIAGVDDGVEAEKFTFEEAEKILNKWEKEA